jgi:hypothetical protein
VRRNTVSKKSYWWIAFIVLLGFSSCKTTRVATTSMAVVKPISTNKLIRNVENNAFDYKHLSIKKIVCQFDNGKTKTSFRANIQADKDKQITVMLTKLNIPVGRLWLTPDSVKFINYLQENYFLDDYSYLSSLMDMNLDFETVNSIISNNVFSLRDQQHDADSRNYVTTIEDGLYVLESVRNPKTEKNNPSAKDRKPAKHSKKLVEDAPIVQRLYVDPVTFKLRKITLKDAVNARSVNIDFSDFVEVGKQLYPGDVSLQLQSPENNMEMKIKLSNFSMEQEKGVRFKVPEKFTRTGHE